MKKHKVYNTGLFLNWEPTGLQAAADCVRIESVKIFMK